MLNEHRIQSILNQLRREVADELTYLMDGFFTNIEVRFFEVAGQRATRDPDLCNTIRELLSKREEISLGFRSAVQTSFDGWLFADQEDTSNPGDDIVVPESAYGVQDHFATILELIDQRSRELVDNAGSIGRLPVAPESLYRCFMVTCLNTCVEGISLSATTVSQRTAPVAASSATICASSVPT